MVPSILGDGVTKLREKKVWMQGNADSVEKWVFKDVELVPCKSTEAVARVQLVFRESS